MATQHAPSNSSYLDQDDVTLRYPTRQMQAAKAIQYRRAHSPPTLSEHRSSTGGLENGGNTGNKHFSAAEAVMQEALSSAYLKPSPVVSSNQFTGNNNANSANRSAAAAAAANSNKSRSPPRSSLQQQQLQHQPPSYPDQVSDALYHTSAAVDESLGPAGAPGPANGANMATYPTRRAARRSRRAMEGGGGYPDSAPMDPSAIPREPPMSYEEAMIAATDATGAAGPSGPRMSSAQQHQQASSPPRRRSSLQQPPQSQAQAQQQQQQQQPHRIPSIDRLGTPSVSKMVLGPLESKIREYEGLMDDSQRLMASLDAQLRDLEEKRRQAEERFNVVKGKHDEYARQHADVSRALRGELPTSSLEQHDPQPLQQQQQQQQQRSQQEINSHPSQQRLKSSQSWAPNPRASMDSYDDEDYDDARPTSRLSEATHRAKTKSRFRISLFK